MENLEGSESSIIATDGLGNNNLHWGIDRIE
jgi:hypothetical protein